MSRLNLLQAPRFLAPATRRSLLPRRAPSTPAAPSCRTRRTAAAALANPSQRRAFTACTAHRQGIMPETDSPSHKPQKPAAGATYTAVEIGDDEYHELSDAYLEKVLVRFEELQDERDDVDIEFSAGVMTISVTDKGTYVINKQPPNKQIWLSSPLSGPKRYDWCVLGDGQADKEGTASGEWVYARDGSSLGGLILEELGVDVTRPLEE